MDNMPRPDSRQRLRLHGAPTEQRPRSDRWFWLAGSLWMVSVAMAVWASPAEPAIALLLGFTTVGALLAWLRPRHPVGWLLLVDGLVWLIGASVHRHVASTESGTAQSIAAAAIDHAGWVVAVGLIPLVLLLFPTGGFHRRPWRIAGVLIVGGGAVLAVAGLLTPGPLPSYPDIENPAGIDGFAGTASIVARVAGAAFFVGLVGGVVSAIARFRASSGLERQQLRWLAFSAALIAVGFLIGDVLTRLGLPGESWFNTLPMLAVPIAVGVALFRYHLWDLDLVVGRTLVYGLIVVVIAAIYIALIAGFGALVGVGGNTGVWLAVLATGIAAALFQPLRDGAVAGVGRVLFRRERDDASVAVRTLGGFRLERDGQPVTSSEWRSRKARRLLKMLVARRGRPVHREQLIDALWPGDSTGSLQNRLAVAASTVRSVLDPDKAYPSDYFVRGADETLAVDLDHLWVDVEYFLRLAEDGLDGDLSALQKAEALYRGDFLVDHLYEDWSQPLREEARATYLAVLMKRAEIELARGPERGIAALLRVLEVDPWDERTHRQLIATLQSAGQHGEARRAHHRYRARMEEIGVSPAPF